MRNQAPPAGWSWGASATSRARLQRTLSPHRGARSAADLGRADRSLETRVVEGLFLLGTWGDWRGLINGDSWVRVVGRQAEVRPLGWGILGPEWLVPWEQPRPFPPLFPPPAAPRGPVDS